LDVYLSCVDASCYCGQLNEPSASRVERATYIADLPVATGDGAESARALDRLSRDREKALERVNTLAPKAEIAFRQSLSFQGIQSDFWIPECWTLIEDAQYAPEVLQRFSM
jgi:hypothetical protein